MYKVKTLDTIQSVHDLKKSISKYFKNGYTILVALDTKDFRGNAECIADTKGNIFFLYGAQRIDDILPENVKGYYVLKTVSQHEVCINTPDGDIL